MSEATFLQDIFESHITPEELEKNASESAKENLKPGPRYGHAVCKYEGLLRAMIFGYV